MGHDAGSNPEGCPAVRSGNSIGGPSEIWSPSGSRASGPGWRRPPLYFGVDTIQVGYIDLALIPLFFRGRQSCPNKQWLGLFQVGRGEQPEAERRLPSLRQLRQLLPVQLPRGGVSRMPS